MFKSLMITSLMIVSTTVQAQVLSAEDFGLTPQTGYVTAVLPEAPCNPASQFIYVPSNRNLQPPANLNQFMTKCDGSNIGWVERTLNGSDLEPNVYRNDRNFNIVSYHNRSATGQPSEINIYTCGRSREDEFVNEKIKPSEDAEGDYKKLWDLKRRKANFKIQLFFNQYVMSGKCIGRITEL